MAVKSDIANVELTTGNVFRSYANLVLGEGDANAVAFGIRAFRDGAPESLAGKTVSGQFIRADGVTVAVSGGLCNGNLAQIVLPAACCAVEGNFTLAIKLTRAADGFESTVRIVDGTVVNTTLGAIVDPGSVIPDLSDYEEAAEAATEAAQTISAKYVYAENVSDDDYRIVVAFAGGGS